MEYKDLLREYIRTSGLSLSEIADRLTEYDFGVTKSYISQLQNGKTNPASDEMNRALAEITGGNSELLLAAAYAAKAPVELKDSAKRLFELIYLREQYDYAQQEQIAAEQQIEDAQARIQKAQDGLRKLQEMKAAGVMEVAQIPVIAQIDSNKTISEHEPIGWDFIPLYGPHDQADYLFTLQSDDSMSGDRIFEKDKVLVRIQERYESGDIVALNVDGHPGILRRIKEFNGKIMLLPSNPKFEPDIVSRDQIEIRGKVVQVVFDPYKVN